MVIERDVAVDVRDFAIANGIKLIVCLLNDDEMRSIGCNPEEYEKACADNGVELMQYPMVGSSPPEDLAQFHADVIQKVLTVMAAG